MDRARAGRPVINFKIWDVKFGIAVSETQLLLECIIKFSDRK